MDKNMIFSIKLLLITIISFMMFGCGETEPNPLAALNVESTSNGTTNSSSATDTGTSMITGEDGPSETILSSPILPETSLKNKAVIALSMGHSSRSPGGRNKEKLTPQNHNPNENPHETIDLSLVVTDIRLVSAVLDIDQNPDWTVTLDADGNVETATLKRIQGSQDIDFFTTDPERVRLFGCEEFDWPEESAPSLPCDFNRFLEVPINPQIGSDTEYNGVLVTFQQGSIDITDNYMGYISEDCSFVNTPQNTTKVYPGLWEVPAECEQVLEISLPAYLTGNTPDNNVPPDPDVNLNEAPVDNNNDNSLLDDYRQADVGQFFLPLTKPRIFTHAVYTLKIDPFSRFSPMKSVAFAPGLGINRWQVTMFGQVSFESTIPEGNNIALGTDPVLIRGTVIQIPNPDIAVGEQLDGNGPLPNPSSANYWFATRSNDVDLDGNVITMNDPIGTLGQPILICTTENCTDPADGGINLNINVLDPDGNPTFCANNDIIDVIACQSRFVDEAFAGTAHVITGNAILLTQLGPDPSGLLGLGTLAIIPTTIQITEVADETLEPAQ